MFTRALLQTAQKVALLVAGVLIGMSLSPRAENSIGFGACRHNGLTEGVWYQDQFDGFKGNQNSSCVEAEWKQGGKSGFSVGLAHLGYLRGSNLATIDDNTYAMKTYTGGACESTGKNCLARFNIESFEYGLTLGAFKKIGPFTLEGGIFFYRSEFEVSVQRVHAESGYPESQNYKIVSYNNTPFLGIALDHKEFYVRARVYQEINQDGEAYPNKGLTSGPAVALTAGVRF